MGRKERDEQMKRATKTATPKTGKQMRAESRMRVERATVRLVKRGGQGVLVPGGFIITATHCVDWSGTGMMALGKIYLARVETASGVRFRAGVYACDPVADIAALGELDNQECPDDADAFEEWRGQVEPVALSDRRFKVGQSCPVFVCTHKREWIAGKVTCFDMLAGSSVTLYADGIEPGTSGSPVVTDDGLLLGIVSHADMTCSHHAGDPCGLMPVAHMALPHWVLARTAS